MGESIENKIKKILAGVQLLGADRKWRKEQ